MAYLRVLTMVAAAALALNAATTTSSVAPPRPLDSVLSRAPLQRHVWFEPNVGQAGPEIRFLARAGNQMLAISGTQANMSMWDSTGLHGVQMRFKGSAGFSQAEALDPLPSQSNYFLGNDKTKWRTHVPHFGRLRLHDVYPGIDVVYYSNGQNLEYDFVVAPGADPSRIELAYEGAGEMRVDESGDLHLALSGREIVQRRPRVYQELGGTRIEVPASYRMSGATVRFAMASFDPSARLIIDPVIDYSVYLAGAGTLDEAFAITTDSQGFKYVTGITTSNDFVSQSHFQDTFRGATDAYVAKYDAGGTLKYFTYLGGKDSDNGRAIVVDGHGDIYVAGDTSSLDFPVLNPAQSTNAGGTADVFVTKIAAAGDNLIYSTFLGGGSDEFGSGLAVDSQGSAYLTGYTRSSNFPTTTNAFMQKTKVGGKSVFITKVAPSGSAFTYSTVVEGKQTSGQESGEGIAVDSAGNAWVTGFTTSSDFPVVSALQPTSHSPGYQDAFVLELAASGSSLLVSTYLGGYSDDLGFRITLGPDGSPYITGYTLSYDFPTQNAAQGAYAGGGSDAFVAKLSPDGKSLSYSTFLGGSGQDIGFADIAVDSTGAAYVAGYTNSRDFPIANAAQSIYGGGDWDGYIAKLAPSGTTFAFVSYFGGSGRDEIHGLSLDPVRNTLSVAGLTTSPDLPKGRNFISGSTDKVDSFIAELSSLGTSAPAFAVDRGSLSFSVSGNGSPVSQTIHLTSTAAPQQLQFTAANPSASTPWLTVTPVSGSTPASLIVTVDPKLLGGGPTSGSIVVTDPATGNKLTIPVLAGLASTPTITSISPSSIGLGSQPTTITVSGSGFTANSMIALNGAGTETTFVNSGTLTAQVPANLLATAGTIQVTVFTGASTSAPVPLTVTGNIPAVSASGIVNAATFLGGPVSPGEIVTVFGTGFGPSTLTTAQLDASGNLATSLAGTRVLIDGVAAPMVYAAQNQVSAIVPYSVAGKTATTVQVEYQGQRSAPVALDVTGSVPGIFTAAASGRGQALVLNEDGTLNSAAHPAPRGSVIVFYATGEGQTNPSGLTGSISKGPVYPKPELPVFVKVSGIDADVIYAAAAPGQVAGLMQVNARIPANAPTGVSIPLVLIVGGIPSPFNVTVAIQ